MPVSGIRAVPPGATGLRSVKPWLSEPVRVGLAENADGSGPGGLTQSETTPIIALTVPRSGSF